MTTVSQRTFASGEVTPSIYSRVDYEKYQTALRTCRNFYVKRHGGLDNRAGTKFVGVCNDSTNPVKLIPFVYDSDNAYILEISQTFGTTRTLRFIKNGDYIYETEKSISSITASNPAVFTSNAHGYSNGDWVKLTDMDDVPELEGVQFIVGGVTANTFTLTYAVTGYAVNSLTFSGSYLGNGSVRRAYSKDFGVSDGASTLGDPFTYTYAQTGNTIVFAHKWGFQQLVRTSDISWAYTYPTIGAGPSIASPASLSLVPGVAGSTCTWAVTTVKSSTYEESIEITNSSANIPTSAIPETLSWPAVSGAYRYNVYKNIGAGFGYIGSTTSLSFVDRGYTPDYSIRQPYSSVTTDYIGLLNMPPAVCQYQQRRVFAGMPNYPETFMASQTGIVTNFYSRQFTEDTDAFAATIVGKAVSRIRHLVDLGKLIAFTDTSEVVLNSDSDAFTPTSVSTKTQSTYGCSTVPPITLDTTALFIEARGSAVRDLIFDFNVDGYKGNELSLFAAHLVDGYTITDWALQKRPHSIIWIVRSDGALLSLTYVKDQGVIGWARHDTDGVVESVACIPNGTEDDVYITVKREIEDGAITVRYTEKMNTRVVSEDAQEDFKFLDSFSEYNGFNDAITQDNSFFFVGGTTWEYDELATLECPANPFTGDDEGKVFLIKSPSTDETITFTVTTYLTPDQVQGYPNTTIPTIMRDYNEVLTGALCTNVLRNLHHLEKKYVTVFADGNVVANPNNDSYDLLQVVNGVLTLPTYYAQIAVGLPYLSDMETLDIDSATSQAMAGESKFIGKVKLLVEKSRGIFVGPRPPSDDDADPKEYLYELKIRNEENYGDPMSLQSGSVEVVLKSEWNSNGRVFVRQIDPLPLSISSVHIDGLFPFTKEGV